MPTRQGKHHNIRPRVLSAVLNLQRFTVQELVAGANLRDRKQAYAQLDILKDDDLISGETMASDRPSLFAAVHDRHNRSVIRYGVIAGKAKLS